MKQDLKAQLELSADAAGVETGVGRAKRSLADLGATAVAAGKQASEGIEQIGEGGAAAATQVDRATKNLIGSIQRTTAALEAGSRSSSEYFAVLANQRGINPDLLKPYLTELDTVIAKQKLAEAALKPTPAALEKVGISAAQAANNLRMVGPQVTDIITSLQGGQKPLTVFIQQGGQLKDIFGGIAPAAKALGGYVLGLINPFTIAAAAAAVLAVGLHEGAAESTAYTRALILSGNAAGTTVGQLQQAAQAISRISGTQGNAADALAQFAATGEVAGQNLQRVSLAAVEFERTAGQAISATVKQFVELGKAPLEGSIKLNESLHYLTLSTYAQIKALNDQGREVEAATVAQKAYADALLSRSAQIEGNLGLIEKAWRGVKDAAKGAWDAMLDVGRTSTLQDQLAAAQKDLEGRQQRGPLNSTTTAAFDKGNQVLRDRIATLQESIALDNRAAASQKTLADQVSARIKFDKDGEQFATNAAKMEREITKARYEGAAAGATQAEVEKRIADIRKKYEDKGAAKTALGIDKAQLGSDIDALQKASQQLVGIFGNQEKILEAQRAAGGISDAEYYQKKRALIIASIEVQDYELQQQVKRYEQEKLTGKDAIDNAKKIADAQAKIAILRADASSKLEVLSIQEEGAAKKLALAFLTARQAAQDYFDTTQRQQQRDLGGIGQGAQARTFNAGASQIEDRYASQRLELENQRARLQLEGKFTDDAKAQYDERLRIIDEFQGKSLSSYAEYYAKLQELQGDASLGAREALKNYYDSAQQLGKQTEDVVAKSLSGIEDAFVALATTGKGNFKSLADSIIADLIRIQVRQAIAGATGGGAGSIAGLLGTLGSLIGGSYNADYSNEGRNYPPRAGGGPVSPGSTYLVGEKGPELLTMGSQAGMVTSNGDLRGGKVVNNVYNNGGGQVATRPNDTGGVDVFIEAAARRGQQLVTADFGSGTGPSAQAAKGRFGLGAGNLPKRG